MRPTHLLLNLAILLLAYSPAQVFAESNEQPDIYFGLYQSDKATTMYQTFRPIIEWLNYKMSSHSELKHRRIKIKIFRSYEEGIQALADGDVDFMRVGPASYVLAKRQEPQLSLIAIENKNHRTYFNGMIIVPSDSSLENIAQLKGKSFAFGDQNSTIGRYIAQAILVENNIYAKDLASYKYMGRHDKVAYSVGLGDYDAGAVKEKTFYREQKVSGIRALKSFTNITKPWVAKANLDPTIFHFLQQSLLSFDNQQVLDGLKISGFSKVKDKDFDFVRISMKKAESFSQQ